MADKVKVSVRLDLDHELAYDHYQTWRSQLEIGFQLHGVTTEAKMYLAAAANLGENACHYLWQKYPSLFAISQQPGESIQAFRARIQKEMRTCKLTSSTELSEVLGIVGTHLFARGLSSASARKSVLEEGTTDLSKAAAKAQAVVLAEHSCTSQTASTPEVNYSASARTPHREASSCRYCGQMHVPGRPNCPAADVFCSKCGKKGHFPAVCLSKPAGDRGAPRSGRSVNHVTANVPKSKAPQQQPQQPQQPLEDIPDGLEAFATFASHNGKTGFVLPTRKIVLDGQHSVNLRVDSASMVTLLPKSMLPSAYSLQPPPCTLQPMGSNEVAAIGVFDSLLSYEGRQTHETVFVLDDSRRQVPALLGERASIQLGLLAAPVFATDISASPEQLSSLPAMRGPISVSLDPDHPPSQQSSRRVAPAMLASLKEQLDAWISQGVVEMVEEVSATDFVSPLVAVPKPDKTVRWCVDLRKVNEAVRRPGVQLPTADDLLAQLSGAKVFSKLDLKSGYSQLEITPECRHAHPHLRLFTSRARSSPEEGPGCSARL